jgi:hypothetical protein
MAICETMIVTGGNDKVAQQSSALSTLLDCTTKEEKEYGIKVAAGAVLKMLTAPGPSFPDSMFHCRKLDHQAISSLVQIASLGDDKILAVHERAKSFFANLAKMANDFMRDDLDEVVIDEDEELLANRHKQKLANMAVVVLERLAQVPQPPLPLRHPLQQLKLRKLKLSSLPVVCLEPRYLIELDASFNKLTSLPAAIGKCDKLVSLNLGNNRLLTLPSTLRRLNKLKFLDVSSNRIRELPSEVSGCVELESLQLSNNELRVMPPTLHYLTALRMLDISSNSLEALPVEIGGCTALTSLNLSGNGPKTTSLSAQLVTMVRPESSKAAGSETSAKPDRKYLTELPQQIGLLPYLTNLQLSGLKLRRPEGIAQAQTEGAKAVIRFLRDSLNCMRQRFAGRLVLLGQPGSGKSALWLAMEGFEHRRVEHLKQARSLSGHMPFQKRRGMSEFRHLVPHKTRGIEIHHTHWDNVELLLWDMAGEPAYSMLHQHFIHQSGNDACIYVLVWDVTVGLEEGKRQIRSQLGELSSIVAQPHVFLIGTHADKILPKKKRAQPKKKPQGARRNSTEVFCEEEDADDSEWAQVADQLDSMLGEMKSVVHRAEVAVTARVLEATVHAMCDRHDILAPTGRSQFMDGIQQLRQIMKKIFCSTSDVAGDELESWITDGGHSANYRHRNSATDGSADNAPSVVMCTELDESEPDMLSESMEGPVQRRGSLGDARSHLLKEALNSRREPAKATVSQAEQARTQWLEDMGQALWALADRLVAATFRTAGKSAALVVDGSLRELLQPCSSSGVVNGDSGAAFARLRPGGEIWSAKMEASCGWYHGGEVVSLRTGHGLGELQSSLITAVRAQRSFGSFQPATYAMLQELVLLNRRRYSPPALMWDQFAAEFGVLSGMGGDKLWAAALQLHKWGIVHFDPQVGAFGNVIILDPQWLGTAMHCLVSHCTEQRGAGIDLEVLRHIWGARKDAHVFPARLHLWLMRLMEHYQLCYLVRHASTEQAQLIQAPRPTRRLSLLQVARRVSASVAKARAKPIEDAGPVLGVNESEAWAASDDVEDFARVQEERRRAEEERKTREDFEFAEGLTAEQAKQEQFALRKQLNEGSKSREQQIAVPTTSHDFRLVWKRTGDVKQEEQEAQRVEDKEARQKLVSRSEKKGRKAIARERRIRVLNSMAKLIPRPVRSIASAGLASCAKKRKVAREEYSESDEEEMEGVLSLAQQEIEEEKEQEAQQGLKMKKEAPLKLNEGIKERRLSFGGMGMVAAAVQKFRRNSLSRASSGGGDGASAANARRLSVAMLMSAGTVKTRKDRRRRRGRNSIEELTFLAGRTNCYIVAALLPEGMCVAPSLISQNQKQVPTENTSMQRSHRSASVDAAVGGLLAGRKQSGSVSVFLRSLARKPAIVTPSALPMEDQTPGGRPEADEEPETDVQSDRVLVSKIFGRKSSGGNAVAKGRRPSAWQAARRASRTSLSMLKGVKSLRNSKEAKSPAKSETPAISNNAAEIFSENVKPAKVPLLEEPEKWGGAWEAIKEYELQGCANPSFFSRLLAQLQGFNEDGGMKCWRSLAGFKFDEHNILVRMHNNPRHHNLQGSSRPIFANASTPMVSAPAPTRQRRASTRRWSLLSQNIDGAVANEESSSNTKGNPHGETPVLEIRVRGELPAGALLALDAAIMKLLCWHWGMHVKIFARPLTKVYPSQMSESIETWAVATTQARLGKQRFSLEWLKAQVRVAGLQAELVDKADSSSSRGTAIPAPERVNLVELLTGVPKQELERTSAGAGLMSALHSAELSYEECILQFMVTLTKWYQNEADTDIGTASMVRKKGQAAASKHSALQPQTEKEQNRALRALFDSFDSNGDGNVSKKELLNSLKSREADFHQVLGLPEHSGHGRKSRAVKRFFRSADDDGDSQLDFDEFVAAVKVVAQEVQREESLNADSRYALDPSAALRYVTVMLTRQLRRVVVMDIQCPSSIRYGRGMELNVQLTNRGSASEAGPLQPLPWLFCLLPTDPAKPQQWADPLHWHNDTVKLQVLSDSIITGYRLDEAHKHPGYALESPMQALKHLMPLIKVILEVVHALAALRNQTRKRTGASIGEQQGARGGSTGGPGGWGVTTVKSATKPEVSAADKTDPFKAGIRRCISKLPKSQHKVKALLDTPYECFAFMDVIKMKFDAHQRHQEAKQKERELQRIQQGKPPSKSHKHAAAENTASAATWFRGYFSALEELQKSAPRGGLTQVIKEHGEAIWVYPSQVGQEGVVWGRRSWELN